MTPLTDSARLQFDIVNIFALTALVGLLTAFVLRFTSYPINLYVIGMFLSVFVSQLILFKGKRPRSSSILAGFIFTFLLVAYLTTNFQMKLGYRYDWDSFGWDLWECTLSSTLGGFLGYMIGVVITAIFLVARKLQVCLASGTPKNAANEEIDSELNKVMDTTRDC